MRKTKIPFNILLHLPRGCADFETALVTAALKPALTSHSIVLRRVPTHSLPRAMRDLQSDECLVAKTAAGLHANTLKCLRWAVHKRHERDVERVHRQLLCDLNGGDEARVRRPRQRRR